MGTQRHSRIAHRRHNRDYQMQNTDPCRSWSLLWFKSRLLGTLVRVLTLQTPSLGLNPASIPGSFPAPQAFRFLSAPSMPSLTRGFADPRSRHLHAGRLGGRHGQGSLREAGGARARSQHAGGEGQSGSQGGGAGVAAGSDRGGEGGPMRGRRVSSSCFGSCGQERGSARSWYKPRQTTAGGLPEPQVPIIKPEHGIPP